MSVAGAALAFAAVAVWVALRGIVRVVRADLAVTAGAMAHVAVAGAALGAAVWLTLAGPEEVAARFAELAGWTGDALAVEAWWERLGRWLRDRVTGELETLLDALRAAAGLG